jgi:Lon protease-like protein
MSDLLPLFPLPNVVLFPNVFLPLHVFETRYREMVADALAGDRLIGMVLLRPGWDRDYEGRPPIYSTGCTGVLTHAERLPDGRFNLVLRGIERFRVLEEDDALTYRRAVVEPLRDQPIGAADRTAILNQRAKLESMVGSKESGAGDPRMPASMSDEDLVHALAQYLELEPLEKQALLETPSLRARAESLVELLEMKIIRARTPGVSNMAH